MEQKKFIQVLKKVLKETVREVIKDHGNVCIFDFQEERGNILTKELYEKSGINIISFVSKINNVGVKILD